MLGQLITRPFWLPFQIDNSSFLTLTSIYRSMPVTLYLHSGTSSFAVVAMFYSLIIGTKKLLLSIFSVLSIIKNGAVTFETKWRGVLKPFYHWAWLSCRAVSWSIKHPLRKQPLLYLSSIIEYAHCRKKTDLLRLTQSVTNFPLTANLYCARQSIKTAWRLR